MALINGGHLVGKYLKEVEKVDIVFGISGGHIEAMLDGFTQFNIRTIDVRHEQAAAMMAHAWSVYTGKPGVCFLTAGPGFANGLTGIANAYLDNAPLVVLCGRHPLRDDLKGALQEINQMDIVKPITKWAATCFDIKRIPEYLSIAFRYAAEGRPGPVFLELPPDILSITVEESQVPMPACTTRKYRMHPDDKDLKAAAELINNAKKPLFLGGSGVGLSHCFGEPQTVYRKNRHSLHADELRPGRTAGQSSQLGDGDGQSGSDVRHRTGGCADSGGPAFQLDISVGTDHSTVGESWSGSISIRMSSTATVRRMWVWPEISASVLGELTAHVRKNDHSQWTETLKAAGRSLLDYELRMRETASDPIHPVRLVAQIQKFVGDDAIYVADGGDTSYFGLAFSTSQKAGVIATAAGLFGCLGTGIPFAMAAKLARPDKKVVVLNGDGSFGFNAMEFDTMVRHNIPVVCVINNDCAWGMIKHSQELSIGCDRLQCAELGTRHYEKVAEALGGHGEFVTKDEEIIPALTRAFASGKPACINVMTDPTITSPATPLVLSVAEDGIIQIPGDVRGAIR